MTPRRPFLYVLRIGGVVLFVAFVVVAILFVQGYEYDDQKNELVKKGLIVFSHIPENALVTVDGLLQDKASKELRLEPGTHTILVSKDGFSSWERDLQVPTDLVVRIPRIILIPLENNAMVARTISSEWGITSTTNFGISYVNDNVRAAGYLSFDDGIFHVVDLPFSTPLATMAGKYLFALSADRETLFRYMGKTELAQKKFEKPISQLIPIDDELFVLFLDGTIGVADFDMQLSMPFAQNSISGEVTTINTDGQLYIFEAKGPLGNSYTVMRRNELTLFSSITLLGVWVEPQGLVIVRDGDSLQYRERKDIPVPAPITLSSGTLFVAPIPNTDHILLTQDNNVLLCTRRGDGCKIVVSAEGIESVVASISGKFAAIQTTKETILVNLFTTTVFDDFLETFSSL